MGWSPRRLRAKEDLRAACVLQRQREVARILDEADTPLSEFINAAIEAYAEERNKKTIFGLEISIERDKD